MVAKQQRYYTYADISEWSDSRRFEIYDGTLYYMASPLETHQDIVLSLGAFFKTFLKNKTCKVMISPFDVCLNAKGEKDDTVLQPDVMIICNPSKLASGKYCNGTPDMAIEILSESTGRNDRIVKFGKYLKAGVREYWIIDTENKDVVVHVLENGRYISNVYSYDDDILVSILDGCVIKMNEI